MMQIEVCLIILFISQTTGFLISSSNRFSRIFHRLNAKQIYNVVIEHDGKSDTLQVREDITILEAAIGKFRFFEIVNN